MPLRVGLTGGIASGKSTVARLFAQRGVEVIDSDQIARELVAPGAPALEEIVAEFGPQVLDERGALDRRRLRARIFSDAQARKRLESILHPRIRKAMFARAAKAESPYVLLIVPLLVENGWQTLVDRVLVVDCAPETQIRRVMARDGIGEAEARAILEIQAGREQRLKAADAVIYNDEGAALEPQVARFDRLFREQAGEPPPR